MENYEQKYKAALGWMQCLYNGLHGKTKEEAVRFFPELKESEGEKIKKLLKHYLEVRRCQTKDNEEYINCNHFLAWLEKQGEKLQGKTALEAIKEEKVDNANKVEPKFKVKYAGSEYDVLEIKEFPGGVIYYGIEDEPNHIDYVLPENCEIISGYGVKEKGSPYPTKSTIFSQQNPAWNEEDDYNVQCLVAKATSDIQNGNVGRNQELIDWLKSIKDRVQPQNLWKPSEEQIQCLYDAIEHYHTNGYPASKLNELYEQMSKIYKL